MLTKNSDLNSNSQTRWLKKENISHIHPEFIYQKTSHSTLIILLLQSPSFTLKVGENLLRLLSLNSRRNERDLFELYNNVVVWKEI
jgi:hypothetical protein